MIYDLSLNPDPLGVRQFAHVAGIQVLDTLRRKNPLLSGSGQVEREKSSYLVPLDRGS
jgi:hypothetical protein